VTIVPHLPGNAVAEAPHTIPHPVDTPRNDADVGPLPFLLLFEWYESVPFTPPQCCPLSGHHVHSTGHSRNKPGRA